MGHPEFTFLLARQRTGTNALRSVLQSNPNLFCFDEVFKIEDRHSPNDDKRISNYFTFLEHYCAGDVTRAFPDQVEAVFDAYLVYLRGLTDKRLKVVDVKYNSTHHVTGTWRAVAEPTLFDLVKARELSVLQLCRRNYLRCLLSHLKAWESNTYYEYASPAPPDRRIVVYADWALGQFERWRLEDELVAAAFAGYAHYAQVEYDDLFPDFTGAIAGKPLETLRGWFGVGNAFSNAATLSKQSSLPLADTIENYDEVKTALTGTRYAYCLQDEGAYR
jgi:hypothetical protein